MKLPIVAYGDPVLRKKATEIELNYPELDNIIANMFETMYAAQGVGLAAPQVGISIRLFIVDGRPFGDDEPALRDFKKVFINPQILHEDGLEWAFAEGCLSIPDVREEVLRKSTVRIAYMDEQGASHEESFSGLAARVIQHEYDHIEGKLFIDRLSPLRKIMLKNKLEGISKGIVKVDYKMKFPAVKGAAKKTAGKRRR